MGLLKIKKEKKISWNIKNGFGYVDDRNIKKYISNHKIKKLHIGCGKNILDGWLNSDYYPENKMAIHLDATKKFPFDDNTFDYIFSEHMIEHISFLDGSIMLKECWRVLKPNGKIRISTPNMRFLIDLYKNEKSPVQAEYIKWAAGKVIKWAPYYDEIFVINNFVRDWGHVFIYDVKTLKYLLEKSGFVNVEEYCLNASDEKDLLNLENETRMPEGFLKLESLTLEGMKL